MEFQAVILAAGHGTRMTDLTASTPKALLPVANRPMIWYPIKMLENAGFEEAIVIVQKAEQSDIQKAMVNCNIKLHLDFVSILPNKDWGTADSLRFIKDKIKADLLLVSCDLITDVPLHHMADLHRTQDATVTMLLTPLPNISETNAPGSKSSKKLERDIVGLNGNKKSQVLFFSSEADFEETVTFKKSLFQRYPHISIKSKMMDGHLYLLKRWVLELLTNDKSMSTVKGELIPYLVKQQFTKPKNADKDIANVDTSVVSVDVKQDVDDLCKEDSLMIKAKEMSSYGCTSATSSYNNVHCAAYIYYEGCCIRANTIITYCEANKQVPRKMENFAGSEVISLVHHSATVDPKSQVGPVSVLGAGSTLSEKAAVKWSVIGQQCTIGQRVKITSSVIMDDVVIEEGSTLNGCIICKSARIGERCEMKDCLVGDSQNVIPMSKFTNEVIVNVDRMMEI